MSFKIGRELFWLSTKSRDIIFRNIEDAVRYVVDVVTEMRSKDEWDEDYFGRLAKLERRTDDFSVTDMTNAMWREICILTWSEEAMAKKELDKVRMDVVKQYDKAGGVQK